MGGVGWSCWTVRCGVGAVCFGKGSPASAGGPFVSEVPSGSSVPGQVRNACRELGSRTAGHEVAEVTRCSLASCAREPFVVAGEAAESSRQGEAPPRGPATREPHNAVSGLGTLDCLPADAAASSGRSPLRSSLVDEAGSTACTTLVNSSIRARYCSLKFLPGQITVGEYGHDWRKGEIRLGSFLFVRTAYWSESRYLRQWREALTRIVTGADVSCLITSLEDPRVSFDLTGGEPDERADEDPEFHASEWWPMYRVESRIYVWNGAIFPHGFDPPSDESAPYGLVPPRRTVNEDGHILSEWEVSLRMFSASSMIPARCLDAP